MVARDKFLTEAIGHTSVWVCSDCDWQSKYKNCDCKDANWSRYKFSTWDRFGLLWEWSQEQEWFSEFMLYSIGVPSCGTIAVQRHAIHPDRFANSVYEFLKDKE